jgi:hypothetical protein
MSSILLTPTSATTGQLPIQTSGTIIQVAPETPFDPLYADDSELFSQSGNDVAPARWIGSVVQADGYISDSMEGDGSYSESYVNLVDKLPSLSGGYFGTSFWLYVDNNGVTARQNILTLQGANADFDAVAIYIDGGNTLKAVCYQQGFKKTTNITSFTKETWLHVFVTIDLNAVDDAFRIHVNNSNSFESITINNSTPSFSTPSKFIVGQMDNNVLDGRVSDLYWSTDPLFTTQRELYFNQPRTSTPYADGSETFTKQGTDVLPANWGLNTVRGQGYTNSSVIGNGVDSYVDLGTPPSLNKFIGMSCWVKLSSLTDGRIFSITDTNDNNHRPFEVAYSSSYGLYVYAKTFISVKIEKLTGTNAVPPLNQWCHIFAYLDLPANDTGGEGSNTKMVLYVDGVNATYYPSGLNDDWDTFPFPQAESITVAASNTLGTYNLFLDGEVSDVHWTRNINFKDEMLTYYNQQPDYRLFERPSFANRETFTQDASGLGDDVGIAKWVGAGTQVDGLIGKSFKGNGTDAYVDLSDNIPPLADFIGCSFMINTAINTGFEYVVCMSNNSSYEMITFGVYINNGKIGFQSANTNGGGKEKITTNAVLSDGVNHNVIVTFDRLEADPVIYVDGVSQAISNILNDNISPSFKTPNTFLIGARYDIGTIDSFYSGEISNFYISTSQDFETKVNEYSNIPTVEIN